MRPFAWIYKNSQASTFDEDGPWSLERIYDQMYAEGLFDVFFYDGVPNKAWFAGLNFCLNELLYAAYDDEELLAFARINNLTGLSGQMHFCFFKAGMEDKEAIAFDLFDDLARGGMKSLLGLTPKPYRHAIRFAESVGFERYGVLPGACYMARKGRCVDGVITVKKFTQGD